MKTCRKCGSTDRYANGKCKPCWKVYHAKWRAENKKKWAAYGAKWKANNIEKKLASNAKYRAEHKEQAKALTAAWIAANPEREKERHKRWRAKNAERVRSKRAEKYSKNKEQVREQTAKWRAAHPEARRVYKQNRRAKETANGGSLSGAIVETLFRLQRGKCACCEMPLGEDYHLDHRVPLARGGAHEDSNMQLLRQHCNQSKGVKDPIEYMRLKGFLL